MGSTFIWGLKRSGIHFVVNWLYANHGATVKDALVTDGLHPQLRDGFADSTAGVAFHNNCGWLYSRQFALGDLAATDLQVAARRQPTTLFGFEDCALEWASRTAGVGETTNVLVLRDPLNNLASRLEATKTRPELFRVDRPFVDLYESYCVEALSRSNLLEPKVVVSYNRLVEDAAYRDGVAAALGLPNHDAVSEVSGYGGGSSFSSSDAPSSATALMTRYRQHPIPPRLVAMLLERDAVREVCTTLFGYDLTTMAEAM